MTHFDCDYMAGAHPEVMRRLVETNMELTPGYGTDPYTRQAKQLIREACGCPNAEVHLLVGGTQTNATVIDGLLARHEGVLAADSAHINVHESGAIEASGHKVLVLPGHDGKVSAVDVAQYIESFYADDTYQHMVAPGMLYISHPHGIWHTLHAGRTGSLARCLPQGENSFVYGWGTFGLRPGSQRNRRDIV